MSAVSIAAKPVYQPTNKVRFVTATSLFDGHDATVNIMRRVLQASGAEVIHLGHNRSVQEIVNAALQEDVQAVAKKQSTAWGRSLDPETEVTVSCGATEAMMATLIAIINPGDKPHPGTPGDKPTRRGASGRGNGTKANPAGAPARFRVKSKRAKAGGRRGSKPRPPAGRD